jgi:hypothetical protein
MAGRTGWFEYLFFEVKRAVLAKLEIVTFGGLGFDFKYIVVM